MGVDYGFNPNMTALMFNGSLLISSGKYFEFMRIEKMNCSQGSSCFLVNLQGEIILNNTNISYFIEFMNLYISNIRETTTGILMSGDFVVKNSSLSNFFNF